MRFIVGQGKSSSSSKANALKYGIHCGKPVIAIRGTTRRISIFLACLNVEAVELCFLVCCYLVIWLIFTSFLEHCGIFVKKYSELKKNLDLFYWRHLNFLWPLPWERKTTIKRMRCQILKVGFSRCEKALYPPRRYVLYPDTKHSILNHDWLFPMNSHFYTVTQNDTGILPNVKSNRPPNLADQSFLGLHN